MSRIGQNVGNYTITAKIGAGGFATVYVSRHRYLDNVYAAIKILDNPYFAEEFLKEAQALRRLDHANIIGIRDFGIVDDKPYILMRYAPDQSLRHKHPQGEMVEPGLVARYLLHIAKGLQYAHDRHIIHRDIKPENLLGLEDGSIVIGDFGLASTISFSKDKWVGTPAYTAPEQIENCEVPASDQYSLGVVAYEWLTGRKPFGGQTMEQLYAQLRISPISIELLAPHVDAEIARVVMRAISYRAEDRYPSVTHFADAFLQAFYAAEAKSRLARAETVEVPIPARHGKQPSSASRYQWHERQSSTRKLTPSGELQAAEPGKRQLDYMAVATVAQALLVFVTATMLAPYNTIGALCIFAVEVCGLSAWGVSRLEEKSKMK